MRFMLTFAPMNGKDEIRKNEQIYLARYLSDRPDYRKMRRFFTGPEWVKGRYSSYANSADTEIRKLKAEYYPEVCRFVV